MIFWKGLGICVPIIPLACFYLTMGLHQAILGKEHFIDFKEYTWIICGFISAIITWKVGKKINQEAVQVTDAKGNRSIRYERAVNHSLYFVAFENWAIAIIVLTGIFAYFS